MTAIGKGDFVEAIKDAQGDYGVIFRKGEVLCVTGLADFTGFGHVCGECGDQVTTVIIVPPHPPGYGSCPCVFRPISGGQPGMFADLLNVPTDAPLEPVAA